MLSALRAKDDANIWGRNYPYPLDEKFGLVVKVIMVKTRARTHASKRYDTHPIAQGLTDACRPSAGLQMAIRRGVELPADILVETEAAPIE